MDNIESTRNAESEQARAIDLDVILTCGGRLHGDLSRRAPDNVKALLEFDGRTLLERALTTVIELAGLFEKRKGVYRVRAIAAVGPEAVKAELQRMLESLQPGVPVVFAAEGISLLDNMQVGYRALSELDAATDNREFECEDSASKRALLIVSPDLPFIAAAPLREFLIQLPYDADLSVPVVTKHDFLERFPGAPNKFTKLAEGYITMGSIFYISPRALEKNVGLFQDAHNSRRNVGKLFGMIGFMTVVKLIFGRLSVHEVEDRVSALTDSVVFAALGCDPALAYDIDNEVNLDYALKLAASSRRT